MAVSADKEIILGIGKEVLDLVVGYAERSKRIPVTIQSIAEDIPYRPAVIISLSKYVDSALMEWARGFETRGPAIGIITGNSTEEISAYLQKINPDQYCINEKNKNCVIVDNLNTGIRSPDSLVQVVSSESASRDFIEALTSQISLLAIFTHSDGIDAFLHEEMTLCPHVQLGKADGPRMPICKMTRYCRRHDMTVSEALEKGVFIDPRNISADVVFFPTCNGYLDPANVIDPVWGITSSFLQGPSNKALITTMGCNLISPEAIVVFMRIIFAGGSLGEIVSDLNASAISRRHDIKFSLFGEPNQYLRPQHMTQDLVGATEVPSAQFASYFQSTLFTKAFLENIISVSPSQKTKIACLKVLENIRVIDFYLWQRYNIGDLRQPYIDSVWELLRLRGHVISKDWLVLCDEVDVREWCQCPVCKSNTSITLCKPRLLKDYSRVLKRCPVCSIISDAPANWELDVQLSIPEISFSGKLLEESSCAILIRSQDDRFNILQALDARDDFPQSRNFRVPKELPPGALQISLIVMRDFDIGIFTVPLHSDEIANHTATLTECV